VKQLQETLERQKERIKELKQQSSQFKSVIKDLTADNEKLIANQNREFKSKLTAKRSVKPSSDVLE